VSQERFTAAVAICEAILISQRGGITAGAPLNAFLRDVLLAQGDMIKGSIAGRLCEELTPGHPSRLSATEPKQMIALLLDAAMGTRGAKGIAEIVATINHRFISRLRNVATLTDRL
jgi:hypothetical protein